MFKKFEQMPLFFPETDKPATAEYPADKEITVNAPVGKDRRLNYLKK